MSRAGSQDEKVNDVLQFTCKLLKTTRPLLTDKEIKIIAEDMIFRAGIKASNAHTDVFKFGDRPQEKPEKKSRNMKKATLVHRHPTDEEKLQKDKPKKRSSMVNSTPNESRVSFCLTTDRKRVYSTANSSIEKNDSSSRTNVFERLYSLRRKPSKKNLEIVQKLRDEEKAKKAAKGEPEIKKKRTSCVVTDDEKLHSTANSSIFNNLSRPSIIQKRNSIAPSFNESPRQSFNRNNSVSRRKSTAQLPREDEVVYASSSSSTVSTTSDYQSGDMMDEVQFDQEMKSMHKKLEKLSVSYHKNLSLCHIDIVLV